MKQLLSWLLVCVLLCSVLVACKPDTPPVDPDNAGSELEQPGENTPTDPSAPTEPENPGKDEQPTDATSVLNSFEKKDFDNFEFVVAASSTYENIFITDQFPTEDDLTGNIVQDALFERDKMIEEYYGLDLVYDDILDSSMFGKIGNSIRSGDDIYSLVLGTLSGTSMTMFNNDLLYDLQTIDTIDLTQSYWNKNSVDAFTLNDKLYMATGAITNRVVRAPYALLFNTRLIDALGLDNPYDLIEQDEWTFENFQYLIMGTFSEVNGDDTPGLEDFYGLAPADDSQTAWFFASGGRWVEAQEGEFVSVYEEKSNYDLLAEVLQFHRTDDVLKYQATYDSNDVFKEGRALFHATALGDIDKLIDMEDKYGIVPIPKYDNEQENYYSNTNKYINTMALIPTSVQDTDMVGLVVETLAAVSQYTSLDKQYDTVLLNRKALDAESKANLQLVVESSFYDWGYVLDPAALADTIRLTMKGTSGLEEFGSFFASIREPVKAALDEIAEKYE